MMRIGRVFFLVGLLMSVTAAPQIAVAGPCFVVTKHPVKQNPDAPIRILGYYATRTANMLNVAFVNASTKPAKAIVWEVRAGDGHAYLRDQGTFSPNVEIRHCGMPYGLHQGNLEWIEDARLRVVRVVFEDGSTWAVPDAPPDDSDL